MERDARIFVAGHRGMVGSAIVRHLRAAGHENMVLRTSSELDLRDQAAVDAFFATEKPRHVFLAAARVGGIMANSTRKAEFIYDNLMIQTNVLHAAHAHGVARLLFLGSSCIYPKHAAQPIREQSLMTGPLEPTNDAYAVAKIAGVQMCRAYHEQHGARFIAAMPTNLYGPGDNYDPQGSHVLPALLRKMHLARETKAPTVPIWGTGTPMREFLHVDDLAEACLFMMDRCEGGELLNVGTGKDLSIRDLALMIREIVGFTGDLVFDTSKPDGTPRKQLDVSRLAAMGWQHRIPLREGIAAVYRDACARQLFEVPRDQ